MKFQKRAISVLLVLLINVYAGFSENDAIATEYSSQSENLNQLNMYSAIDDIKNDFIEEFNGFRKFDLGLLSTSASVSLQTNELDIHKSNDDSASLHFVPNNPIPFALAISYNGITIMGAYGKNDQQNQYNVTSQCFALQGFYYTKYFGLDVYYEKFSGYYLDNLSYDPSYAFPDLELETKTINLYYNFSGNASLRELNEPEAILKHGIFSYTAFVLTSFSMRSINSSSVLIPATFNPKYPSLSNLKYFDSNIISCAIGIASPMHLWGFYLMPALTVGFGYPFFSSNISLSSAYDIKVNLKAQIGFTSKHFSIGMDAVDDSDAITSLNTQEMIQFHSINVDFFTKIVF